MHTSNTKWIVCIRVRSNENNTRKSCVIETCWVIIELCAKHKSKYNRYYAISAHFTRALADCQHMCLCFWACSLNKCNQHIYIRKSIPRYYITFNQSLSTCPGDQARHTFQSANESNTNARNSWSSCGGNQRRAGWHMPVWQTSCELYNQCRLYPLDPSSVLTHIYIYITHRAEVSVVHVYYATASASGYAEPDRWCESV